MQLSGEQTKKLLEYQGRMQIKQLILNMTVMKFKRPYQAGPKPELVSECAAALNLLFERFPANMQPDYEWIASL